MTYKTNGEESIMKTTHETSVRVKNNMGRCRASGLALAALLTFGYAMPAHGVGGFPAGFGSAVGRARDSLYDMGVTLATIRVPVKLHQLPASSYYIVACDVYDRPHGSLRKRGSSSPNDSSGHGYTDASGDADTTVVVPIHPLKSVSSRLPLVTWMCHLNIISKGFGLRSGSHLATMAKSGTPFRGNVGGSF